MRPLQIEPVSPFRVPERPFQIIVVGCGGNGSHVATGLGRLCYHLRETNGPPVNVVLIDGDHFERKNVGRQLCRPRDVGVNKAKALAARINGDYGLRFEAIPEMLTGTILQELIDGREDSPWSADRANVVVVGCVDSALARATIHEHLAHGLSSYGRRWLWLDVGNHEYTGQVMLGSVRHWDGLFGALRLGGLCGALPSPGLLMPDLIMHTMKLPKTVKVKRGKKAPPPPMDCATDALENRQAFNINAVLANIALEYLTQLTVERAVTRLRTTVDLAAFVAASDAITPSTLAALSGRSTDWLRGIEPPAPPKETPSERAPDGSVRKRGRGKRGAGAGNPAAVAGDALTR